MNEEVFKQNAFIPYLISVVFLIGTFLLFIFAEDIGLKFFIVLFIPAAFLLEPLLTKVWISEDEIHYKKISGKEVVSLHYVKYIMVREEESIEESIDSDGKYERRRVVQRIVYVLDEQNHPHIAFPEKYVRGKNWCRFIEVVKGSNPSIEIK